MRFFPRPKMPRTESNNSFARQQAQKRKSRKMAARTPMTIPAIAPPESPLFCAVAVTPVTAEPSVPMGVWKGTVVVAVPVNMTVAVVALVGRMNAEPVVTGATKPFPFEELPPMA